MLMCYGADFIPLQSRPRRKKNSGVISILDVEFLYTLLLSYCIWPNIKSSLTLREDPYDRNEDPLRQELEFKLLGRVRVNLVFKQ